jgi:hypothetical protein
MAQANPFAAYIQTGHPYQLSPYPGQPLYGQPTYGPPPPQASHSPPPLPQEQLVGAGTYGQGKN